MAKQFGYQPDKDQQIAMLEHKLKKMEKLHGPYIDKRGTHNFKNLFRRPTMYEWVILIMIIMALFMGWAYQEDTRSCRETMANIDSICVGFCAQHQENVDNLDLSELNFTFNNG